VGIKSFKQILAKRSYPILLYTGKRYLRVLIVFVLIGTLGPVSHHKVRARSWPFTLRSSIHRLHLLPGLIQRKYVLFEDDSSLKDSKRSSKQFTARNLELLASHFHSYWLSIFDRVRQSSYIAFFASFPLRSPPTFS
jgi:hypothetical protein